MAKTTSKQSPRLTLSYCEKKVNLCYNEVKRYRKDDDLCLVVTRPAVPDDSSRDLKRQEGIFLSTFALMVLFPRILIPSPSRGCPHRTGRRPRRLDCRHVRQIP